MPATDALFASVIIDNWQTRHLHSKALLITPKYEILIKYMQKRWLSLLQSLQQERSQTIDADRLLSLTYTITRMQQMQITASTPSEYPAAHLWSIAPSALLETELPRTCKTIYIGAKLTKGEQEQLLSLAPPHTLITDYTASHSWHLTDKAQLEEKVHNTWEELIVFLKANDISMTQMTLDKNNIDYIDDALDTLLNQSSTFLRHARQFQEAFHLAQPLKLTHAQLQEYELINLLARRVTMLTPGLIHHSFIKPENDTFSLYDFLPQVYSRQSLTDTVKRHISAGRFKLAKALEVAFVNNISI
jgi:hypothetical protein